MTRKEEIRDKTSGIALDAVKSITVLNNFILELTAPESSPTQYAGNGGTQCLECGAIYSKDAWDKCPFCSKSVLNAQTGQSSPAPLESQEELWSNIITSVFHGETNIGLQSKFILTRRKKVSPDLNKYKDLEDSY